jgi:lipopolysaccharide transport system ATP-binding protein
MDRGRVLVFTSHNLDLVGSLCTRVLWLRNGVVVKDGPASEIIPTYIEQESRE